MVALLSVSTKGLVLMLYSQTELDLQSHRWHRKQTKVLLILYARVY